ncbi:hypothetical protein P170DRAFT_429183 [Aspergillus steynii IBT 23096]|uniref:Uncharacterized protein n=1 Tax=Aspergillus steynii IBT 23096 TaxID=1392250 RepID=A0A2I2FZM4_9EURO|nr:uncharacterized protein P170DRAFT_429183 [Aspergillus steynii IBT 23096]PLB46026.1 hypothetical protein P170DRAFT_429183 [Aspergillus steynii IBT 23096]
MPSPRIEADGHDGDKRDSTGGRTAIAISVSFFLPESPTLDTLIDSDVALTTAALYCGHGYCRVGAQRRWDVIKSIPSKPYSYSKGSYLDDYRKSRARAQPGNSSLFGVVPEHLIRIQSPKSKPFHSSIHDKSKHQNSAGPQSRMVVFSCPKILDHGSGLRSSWSRQVDAARVCRLQSQKGIVGLVAVQLDRRVYHAGSF